MSLLIPIDEIREVSARMSWTDPMDEFHAVLLAQLFAAKAQSRLLREGKAMLLAEMEGAADRLKTACDEAFGCDPSTN